MTPGEEDVQIEAKHVNPWERGNEPPVAEPTTPQFIPQPVPQSEKDHWGQGSAESASVVPQSSGNLNAKDNPPVPFNPNKNPLDVNSYKDTPTESLKPGNQEAAMATEPTRTNSSWFSRLFHRN
jgi:hypothetical protein